MSIWKGAAGLTLSCLLISTYGFTIPLPKAGLHWTMLRTDLNVPLGKTISERMHGLKSSIDGFHSLFSSKKLEDWESVDQRHETSQSEDSPKTDGQNSAFDEYNTWCRCIDETVASLVKKQNALEKELEKANDVEQTVIRAQLLTANLFKFKGGVTCAAVQDWHNNGTKLELFLNPQYKTAALEADALFKRARKLKRGSAVISDLLDETHNALTFLSEIRTDFGTIEHGDSSKIDVDMLKLFQDRLLQSSRRTGFKAPTEDSSTVSTAGTMNRARKAAVGTPASNLRKLTSPAGCTIVVGRNRRGNEYLTFSMARGNDIWLHSRGCPGAHVLIQQRRGSAQVTEECLQLAADLAVFYSDARREQRADVMAAEPKHILKPRGSPLGTVKVREEWKVLAGFPDNVPRELKEAREESGQLEEYRAANKAKHRKRNKEATKQQKAKERSKTTN
jgi:hypothetical protein